MPDSVWQIGQAFYGSKKPDSVWQIGQAFYGSKKPDSVWQIVFAGRPPPAALRERHRACSACAKADAAGRQTVTDTLLQIARFFPLPWSHYLELIRVEKADARAFYESEALRNGWTVRQLERQITTLFYERTLASRNKAAMLRKGAARREGEAITPEQEIKDPLVLEFLGLKDEYSENDLEEALIRDLETLLLELGGDFTFVGRQKRLRVGDDWYRIDLLFFHRRLRCLIIVDLNLRKLTHSDAGQMHLYLNYAREHWMLEGENPPVGLILSTRSDSAVVHYALEGLPNKVLAAEYRTTLPDEATLVARLQHTRKMLEMRKKRR